MTRFSAPALLVLGLLCMLLPFVTVGCEEPETFRGIHFVEGNASDFETNESEGDTDVSEILESGAATITLAIVFAVLGTLTGLLPGLVAAAATCAAALVTAGMLVASLLSGSLRGASSLFVDYRYGFWATLAFSVAAAGAAWRRWNAYPRVVGGRAVVSAFGGAALLTLAALVPQISPASEGEEENMPPADGGRGFPVVVALVAGTRRSDGWDAAALVGVPFIALVLTLLLIRQESRLAAWALAGLGAGWGLTALLDLAYFGASDVYAVGDGAYFAVLGSLALAAAGVAVGRSSRGSSVRLELQTRILVVIGAGLAVAGTLLPFRRASQELDRVALLYGGESAMRLLAVAPIVIAVAAVVAAWLLPRARAAAFLVGLGVALLFAFIPLLSPLLDNEEGFASRTGPGAFVGAAGALAIVAAGLWAARRDSLRAGADPSRIQSGSAVA